MIELWQSYVPSPDAFGVLYMKDKRQQLPCRSDHPERMTSSLVQLLRKSNISPAPGTFERISIIIKVS